MSGATFPRIKNWVPETLTNTDLNAEIDNILNNLGPAGVDSYSGTTATMKLQTSPGGLGSESLATSLAGELERLRYVIQRIIGSSVSYWYQAGPSSLTDLVASLGTGLPVNRIVSGRTTGNSSQLCALIPSGTTASLTLTASSAVPFNYYIAGISYSITASTTITLALASSTAASAQTTMIDPVAPLANSGNSKGYGMYNTTLGVQSANATFSTFIGQICGFKLTNTPSGTAEYAMGYIVSSAAISNAWRGAFFDSSANRVVQQDLTGGATGSIITLMKLGWIFANTASSLAVTYANPFIGAAQPSGPSTGDYWFDTGSTAWKTYNSTTWIPAGATLIGISIQDTAACIAARTFDKYIATTELNNCTLTRESAALISAQGMFSQVSIFGNTQDFKTTRPQWHVTTSVAAGTTMSASTTYFLYMKEDGSPTVSDQYPLYRRDLKGLYHPGETWRALGVAGTDGSTTFQTNVKSLQGLQSLRSFFILDPAFYGTAGYTSLLNNTSQGTNVLPERFIGGQFVNITPSGLVYADIATLSLTPGIWALSSQLFLNASSGTPIITPVSFGFGVGSGTAQSGLALGLSYNSVTFITNATPSVIGVNCVIPRYVVNTGLNGTTFYLKFNVQATGSGVIGLAGSYLAERLDYMIGMP